MFYRRKILMALLESFGGKLEKIVFQKLLFLLTERQENSVYSFIPFYYGSYSISANADLTAMVRCRQLVEDSKFIQRVDQTNYIDKLIAEDRKILAEVKNSFGNLENKKLLKYVYLNFCYYAINSKIAGEILSESECEQIALARPASNKTILFTIGYEGIAFEEYLNRLIKSDVQILVDVRSNPVSMKFGFSQKTLKLYCEKLGIEYLHLPELGIRSEYRQSLKQQADYHELFRRYQETTLKQTTDYQQKILMLLRTKRRIALTCFESDITKCHRKYLVESIVRLSDWEFELKHL